MNDKQPSKFNGPLKWVVSILIVMILVGFLLYRRNSEDGTAIIVGAVLPLTGEVGQYGQFMKQGLELALDDAVAQGMVKQGQVRLVVEDGGGEPAKSLNAFRKLLAADKPVAVVAALSGVILPIKPLANKNHIVLLNGSSISTEIEDADDYSFSVIPNAAVEGSFLAEFATKRGDKTAGILYRNDASGKAFYETFKTKFETLGGKIVFTDSHNPNEGDFRPFIAKTRSVPQMGVLFMASYGPEVAKYLQQALEQGASRRLLAYTTFYSPKVLEIAGNAAEGVCFSAPAFDALSDQPKAVELRDKITKHYGSKESNYYIASHYDAMMLLLEQIRAGSHDATAIRNRLANTKSYEGLSGTINFDKNGGCTLPLKMYHVENGKFTALEP
jgi:branched-chain amino acid transport system substrate-binding protein